jgi:hypothetical protein
MAKATIEIPPGFEEMFRFATAIEVESDAEWVHGVAGELRKRATAVFAPPGPDEAKQRPLESKDLGDVLGASAYLPKAVAIAEQAFAGETTIEGEPDVLAHICEGLTRWVIPGLLEHVPGPLDTPQSNEEITPILEAFDWSAREAVRLYGLDREVSA